MYDQAVQISNIIFTHTHTHIHTRTQTSCTIVRHGLTGMCPVYVLSQVVRSADLISYTAEEGVRMLGEGKLLSSDSFPGNARNKLCMVAKVRLLFNVYATRA